MRSPQHQQGRRNGVKACVEWLHARAEQMNDPHARQVLNSAATNLGWEMRADKARTDESLSA